MTTIKLKTTINATIETVFNNCRNIDIHQYSASKTNEKSIAGRTSGLIEKGETVTWQGKHFGFYIKHQSIISEMEFPHCFVDEQLKGKFKKFKHTHTFKKENNAVLMVDELVYEVPYGIIGKLFDKILLKNHLTQFIIERNNYIKKISENQQQ